MLDLVLSIERYVLLGESAKGVLRLSLSPERIEL
jgi:hypothetical protein